MGCGGSVHKEEELFGEASSMGEASEKAKKEKEGRGKFFVKKINEEESLASVKMSHKLTMAQLKACLLKFQEADKDGSGELEYPEFCKVLGIEPGDDYAKQIFKVMDKTDSNKVSYREFIFSAAHFNNSGSQADKVHFFFQVCDTKGKGWVDEYTLINMLHVKTKFGSIEPQPYRFIEKRMQRIFMTLFPTYKNEGSAFRIYPADLLRIATAHPEIIEPVITIQNKVANLLKVKRVREDDEMFRGRRLTVDVLSLLSGQPGSNPAAQIPKRNAKAKKTGGLDMVLEDAEPTYEHKVASQAKPQLENAMRNIMNAGPPPPPPRKIPQTQQHGQRGQPRGQAARQSVMGSDLLAAKNNLKSSSHKTQYNSLKAKLGRNVTTEAVKEAKRYLSGAAGGSSQQEREREMRKAVQAKIRMSILPETLDIAKMELSKETGKPVSAVYDTLVEDLLRDNIVEEAISKAKAESAHFTTAEARESKKDRHKNR